MILPLLKDCIMKDVDYKKYFLEFKLRKIMDNTYAVQFSLYPIYYKNDFIITTIIVHYFLISNVLAIENVYSSNQTRHIKLEDEISSCFKSNHIDIKTKKEMVLKLIEDRILYYLIINDKVTYEITKLSYNID